SLAALALSLALAACSGGERADVATAEVSSESDMSGRGIAGGSAGDASASMAPAPAPAPASMRAPTPPRQPMVQTGQTLPDADDAAAGQTVAGQPMLIRTANASVRVADVDSSVVRLRALAAQVGGFVTSSTMQSGDYEVRSATLEIKVP